MSALEKVLLRGRDLASSGAHRLGGMLMLPDLLLDASGGNGTLAALALDALDEVTPKPWTASQFIDGAAWSETDGDTFGMVYQHDRSPAEIASLFGRAAMRASRMLEDA